MVRIAGQCKTKAFIYADGYGVSVSMKSWLAAGGVVVR